MGGEEAVSARRLTLRERLTGKPRFARQHLQTGFSDPTRLAQEEDEEEASIARSPGLQGWQELVLKYADKVPICGAATRFYEDSTKRVRYNLVDMSTRETLTGPNPANEAIDILNIGVEEMARAVGLRFLIGESRHTIDRDTKEFRTYGAGELFMRGSMYRMRDRNGKENELAEHLDAWRSYDPDRKWSDLATSSHKPLLDVLEAFIIAYAEERAVSIRLALNTGILAVSEEIFAIGGDADAVNSEGSDPAAQLEARFQKMLSMTIKDPRNAASFVPPVVIVPGANVDQMIEHVSVAQDRDKRKIAERIDMLKEEYAVGADLPADIAKGFMADLNHWNAWSVDESAWKNYLAPKIQATATDAFIEIAKALDIDITGLDVGLDNSDLLSPKGLKEAAFDAHDRLLISDAAARKYTGFTENDKPSESELEARRNGDDNVEYEQEVPQVTDEIGDGVTASAKEGQNLDELNRLASRARHNFERELRDAVIEGSIELAREVHRYSADHRFAADPESNDPIERVAANILGVIKRGWQALGLAAARALATERAAEWYERHADRLDRQAESASTWGAKLIYDWLRVHQTESLTGRDATQIARSIESMASGGQSTVTPEGIPTEARPETIMEDRDFLTMIREEGSARPVYEWEHGSPPLPFAPHVALDGVRWTQEDERSILNNPQDFPKSAIYHPGDHEGCTCRYEINFERI